MVAACLILHGSISGVVFKQVVFNSPVNITDTTIFDMADGTLVLNGPLSGEGGLVVNGGTLNLGSDNSQFTGQYDYLRRIQWLECRRTQ